MTPPFPLASVRAPFRAVARAAVPPAASLDRAGWDRLEAGVTEGLRDRPPAVVRQVRAFLVVLELLGLLRHGRRFSRLDPARASRLLHGLERSRLLLLRRGVWGVRTLAFMGYYAQPEVHRALGYRGAAGGWEVRGTDAGPWPDRGGAGPAETGVPTSGEPPDA